MNKITNSICIMFLSEMEDQALILSSKLKLPLFKYDKSNSSKSDFALLVSERGLEIIHLKDKSPGPISCNFISGPSNHRRLYGGGKSQNLAKAVGIKSSKKKLYIMDLTAGLGRDGFILASLGAKVLMLERNDILAALIADGLDRARSAGKSKGKNFQEIFERIKFINEDSINYLNKVNKMIKPDIIYLDPMFPVREKSSKVKKEMQLLQVLIGSDEDSGALLSLAMERAKYRVVVKRPIHSKFLSDQQPSFSLRGKSTRFDIYSLKKISS